MIDLGNIDCEKIENTDELLKILEEKIDKKNIF
jgi:hypothetical protein